MEDEDVAAFERTGAQRTTRAFGVAEIVLREMQDLPSLDIKKELEWVQALLDEVLLTKDLPLIDLSLTEDDYIEMSSSTRILA